MMLLTLPLRKNLPLVSGLDHRCDRGREGGRWLEENGAGLDTLGNVWICQTQRRDKGVVVGAVRWAGGFP